VINSCAVSERRSPHRLFRLIALLAVLSLVLGLAACGDDEDEGSGDAGGTATSAEGGGNPAERGFLEAMVPHHESAISMAEIGVERAEDPRIKKLAEAIRDAQEPEIEQMRAIHQRLFGSALKPNMAGHDALGLSASEAGMDMDHEKVMKMLETADPFDRAFVDEMVPHHEGAVKMAEAVLKETDDAELKKLAQAIIDAQRREIREMNAFRSEKYGGPVREEQPDAGGEHGGGMEGH
jgi:uncharacterized protein (DUF305 family)